MLKKYNQAIQKFGRTLLLPIGVMAPIGMVLGITGAFVQSYMIARFPVLGNPVICPSCTYHKGTLGEPLFQSPYKFALDWDTLWRLAGEPGRFLCVERPLLYYRIHDGATTKACIVSQQRAADETAMYERIWPRPMVRVLMHFYKKAYQAYDSE